MPQPAADGARLGDVFAAVSDSVEEAIIDALMIASTSSVAAQRTVCGSALVVVQA